MEPDKEKKMKLEIRDLSAGYDGQRVIKGINAAVEGGEVVALIGENGSGKSTLIRTVASLILPMEGGVYLEGKLLGSMSASERARHISVLLTGNDAAPHMTCRRMASMGRYPYTGLFGALSDRDSQVVEDALALTGCTAFADREYDRLSDGQKQRVLIARALCQEPDILVLDEPTAFLDIRYRFETVALLRSLASKKGIGVLFSVHSPYLAIKGADRILALKDGECFYFGASRDFDSLRDLFDMDSISMDEHTAGDLYGYAAGYGRRENSDGV